MAYYQRQGLLLVYRGSNGAKNFGNVQNLQFFHKESPKSYARMGRAEALVARRFNRGPQRASLEWGEEERWSALFRHAEIL